MKRVVLECRGRLANQVLCYANARHVLTELGFTDRLIVINYPIPEHCVTFPGAVVEKCISHHLPRVTRGQISEQSGDCLWAWEDVYFNTPPGDVIPKIIQSIKLEDSFAGQLEGVITNDRFVGIHARFGDFVSIDPANPPKSLPPFIRGTNDYFLGAIETCRSAIHGVKFFLASDGNANDVEFLTRSPDVVRGWPAVPLFDLFALSRCRLIIGSASTFSSVAAHYGNIPMSVPTMTRDEVDSVVQSALQ